MPAMKKCMIYLLIGPKGSGKSYLGQLMEKYYGIRFLRVEDWARQIKRDRAVDNEIYLKEVFAAIEAGVRKELELKYPVVFESTGLTGYFDAMLENLKRDYAVKTIAITTDPTICLQRVRSRDQSIHINVSDAQVSEINARVVQKQIKTDFIIDNSDKQEEDLRSELESILEIVHDNRFSGRP
jgi:dephospho-CoA kinase